MAIQLPGNVRFVKDGGRQGELDIGDQLGFPSEKEGEEACIEYTPETAVLVKAMVEADDEYPSYRLASEDFPIIAEAFVTYVPDSERLTFQSVRFTGDIQRYIKRIAKPSTIAQK